LPDRGLLGRAGPFDGKARSYPLGGEVTRLPRPQVLHHAGTANVYGLGLSADGRTLATSSGDQTVRIWRR
jgi:WD40 repeat protein